MPIAWFVKWHGPIDVSAITEPFNLTLRAIGTALIAAATARTTMNRDRKTFLSNGLYTKTMHSMIGGANSSAVVFVRYASPRAQAVRRVVSQLGSRSNLSRK